MPSERAWAASSCTIDKSANCTVTPSMGAVIPARRVSLPLLRRGFGKRQRTAVRMRGEIADGARNGEVSPNDGPGAAIIDRGGGAEEVDHPQRAIVAVSTVTLPLTVVRPIRSRD